MGLRDTASRINDYTADFSILQLTAVNLRAECARVRVIGSCARRLRRHVTACKEAWAQKKSFVPGSGLKLCLKMNPLPQNALLKETTKPLSIFTPLIHRSELTL